LYLGRVHYFAWQGRNIDTAPTTQREEKLKKALKGTMVEITETNYYL